MLQIRVNDRIPVLILKAQHILVIQVEASWKNQVWTGYRLKTMTVLSHVAMAPLSALLAVPAAVKFVPGLCQWMLIPFVS